MHRNGDSRVRILEAALSLFSEKGYEGASTREICELAGITKPTLYYFFQNKEDVYRALIDCSFKDFKTVIESGLSEQGSFRERLRLIAEQLFEQARSRPDLVKFLFSAVYSPNLPFSAQVQSSYESSTALLLDAIKKAIRNKEISQGNDLVRLTILMGGIGESISNSLMTGRPKLTRSFAHSIIDSIFDGWSPADVKVHR